MVWSKPCSIDWVRSDTPGSVFSGPGDQLVFDIIDTRLGIIAVGLAGSPAGGWDAAIRMVTPPS